MNNNEQNKAAEAAVRHLMKVDRAKALAVAVLIASSSAAGCTTTPQNRPCPDQSVMEPCVQPSGAETGWLSAPRWPAVEGEPGKLQGEHLASREEFVANPQYTQLRANEGTDQGGPRYYGGGHYFYYSSGSSSGSGSSSS